MRLLLIRNQMLSHHTAFHESSRSLVSESSQFQNINERTAA